MLVLKRREGEEIVVTHRSGDVLRIRLDGVELDPRRAALGFDDPALNFEIDKAERRQPPGWLPRAEYLKRKKGSNAAH